MNNLNKLAKKLFKAVADDLRNRRGLLYEWNVVDKEAQIEIRNTNEKKILEILKKELPK